MGEGRGLGEGAGLLGVARAELAVAFIWGEGFEENCHQAVT
ncbi:hypothetical protein BJ982_004782 [Sphaerisporangium siamense]|uniref:Uncharacterized protein n=1 Tax=Sphaerisporangium siamense TaxID=795645 RepID=A0A7W7G9V1_9ACTN|nr:hypothetical protein [Sphaerisporangium siamense]